MSELTKHSLLTGAFCFIGAIVGIAIGGNGIDSWMETISIASAVGFFAIAASAITRIAYKNMQARYPAGTPQAAKLEESKKAWVTISGSLIFIVAAFLLALFTKINPLSTFEVNAKAIVWGVLSVVPLLLILLALELIKHPAVFAFREKQTKFFAQLGFEFTPLRILLLSIGAGVGEELLFRGALQGWLQGHLPMMLAVLIPSIIFGLLHSANIIYMIIAGTIGVYLGIIFVLTNNILVPMIAHTVYDIIAFIYTDRLVRAWRIKNSSNPEIN